MRVSDQRMFVTRASLASAALIGCRVRQTSPRLSLTHCRSSFCTMSESRDSATGPMVIDEAGDTTQDTTADVLTSKKESSPVSSDTCAHNVTIKWLVSADREQKNETGFQHWFHSERRITGQKEPEEKRQKCTA